MSVIWHRHKFRCLIYITILSVILLLWIYRSNRTLQFLTPYFQTANNLSEPQGPVQPRVHPQCTPRQIVPHGQKVVVNGTKTLLLSAYQEHRSGKREVRVLAVVLRSETVAYHCLLCCQGQLHISEGFKNIHSDHFGFRYGTADIMCPVPSDCGTPSHITVTSAAHDSEDKCDREFFEVQNQEEKHDSFTYNFTVCISTMFEFNNVLQLVQSLEMLKLLGVNRVAIYRTNNSPETQRILDYYTNKGLIEVIPWSLSRFMNVSRSWLPQLGPGDLHYFGQIPALNDCLYRYMYQTRYVAQHDIDELILPQSVNSWLELLPQVERLYGADKCYMFVNNVFPNTVTLPPPGCTTVAPPSPVWQRVPGVNILSHLYHEPVTDENAFGNFKIIFNPRTVSSTSVHGVLHSRTGCSWVKRHIARMYHIREPRDPNLKPDQLVYDDRLLSYSVPLTTAVITALKESGLIQEDTLL